jgi:hypothetical protein
VLIGGVFAVATGVVCGVYATVKREPGRPAISVERVNESTLRVAVTGEGLAAGAKFEGRIEAYNQTTGNGKQSFIGPLVSARFSPQQNGHLKWERLVDISSPGEQHINYVQVIVAEGDAGHLTCAVSEMDQGKTEAPTCLYTRLPPVPPASSNSSAALEP